MGEPAVDGSCPTPGLPPPSRRSSPATARPSPATCATTPSPSGATALDVLLAFDLVRPVPGGVVARPAIAALPRGAGGDWHPGRSSRCSTSTIGGTGDRRELGDADEAHPGRDHRPVGLHRPCLRLRRRPHGAAGRQRLGQDQGARGPVPLRARRPPRPAPSRPLLRRQPHDEGEPPVGARRRVGLRLRLARVQRRRPPRHGRRGHGGPAAPAHARRRGSSSPTAASATRSCW